MTTEKTSNYRLNKPSFRTEPWHDLVNDNFDLIDAAIAETLQVAGVAGMWALSTAYTVGQRVVEDGTGTIYTCLVGHTSPSSGTFATYRSSNPTHWESASTVLTPRGAWDNDTAYSVNDLAYSAGEGLMGICIAGHTSNSAGDMGDDSANWTFLVDITASVASSDISYDNTISGLAATNVKTAIDEIDDALDTFTAALAAKAPLASPTFTGAPLSTTPATNDNSTKIATTAYVKAQVASSTVAGMVELATDAEAQAKALTTRALTPDNLAALGATSAFAGLIELATDAEAQAKSSTARALTPANLAALGISDTQAGLIEAAVQSEMEAASSTVLAVTPGRQQFHPSAAKAWAIVSVIAGAPSIVGSYNITSITDTGVGELTITIATDFASASWAGFSDITQGGVVQYSYIQTKAAGTIHLICRNASDTLSDPAEWHFTGFGDQ